MIKCLKSKIENLEFTSENHLSEPDTNPISYKFKNWISKSDKNNYHHFFPQKMIGQTWTNEPIDNICNM